MDLTQRIDCLELMDTQTLSPAVMRDTLAFLSVTNRYFGGAAVVLSRLKNWSSRWRRDQTIRILDVGTGGAEIPMAIIEWAKEAGVRVQVTAIDLVPEVVDIARENARAFPEISVQCEDVFELNDEFDYVVASLLLHHIRPADSTRLLRHFDEIARRGMIISDLLRSSASYWAVSALSHLIGNKIVRHDGPLSVRRAFRIAELESLAREANLSYVRAKNEPWFRVSLAGEKI